MIKIIAKNPRQIERVIDKVTCKQKALTLANDYQTLFGSKWKIGIRN